MKLSIRTLVCVSTIVVATALGGCGKAVPPIEGSYQSNDRNFQMSVQTTTLMTVTTSGKTRRATFEQDGDDLTIRSDDSQHPAFEFTAKVIKDEQAVQWLTVKNLDTGKKGPWKDVVLSHVVH